MCRQISAAFLCMCNAFPTEKGEQMILMSFSDVTTALLMHQRRGYIRKTCARVLGLLSGFFGAEHSGNFLNKATNPL